MIINTDHRPFFSKIDSFKVELCPDPVPQPQQTATVM